MKVYILLVPEKDCKMPKSYCFSTKEAVCRKIYYLSCCSGILKEYIDTLNKLNKIDNNEVIIDSILGQILTIYSDFDVQEHELDSFDAPKTMW